MNYKIDFKNSVSKDLKKIGKPISNFILDKIENELSTNPKNNLALKGKFKGLYKFRINDYRVIYIIINDDTVLILRIGHRKEVYKN